MELDENFRVRQAVYKSKADTDFKPEAEEENHQLLQRRWRRNHWTQSVRTRDQIPHIKKQNYGKEPDLREQHEWRKEKVGTKTKPS